MMNPMSTSAKNGDSQSMLASAINAFVWLMRYIYEMNRTADTGNSTMSVRLASASRVLTNMIAENKNAEKSSDVSINCIASNTILT